MPFKPSEPSGTSQSICTRTFRNLPEYLRFHRLSARETSTTSPGICIETLQNLTRYSICTETLRNLTSYLHLNFLEPSCAGTLCNLWLSAINPLKPHQVSEHRNPLKPQQGICTGTLSEPVVEAAPDRTRANLG